jgi:autotransporter-associated beta strand protein
VTILNVQNSTRTFTFGGSGAGGGHMWDFSGTIDFGTNNGSLRINNDNSTFNFGSSNATFNVGTGTAGLNQRNGGTTTHFGALIGSPTSTLAGRGNTGTAGTTTYSIGGKNVDCTFAGSINNGSGTTAITKVGTAKLTLSGTGTHTGATSVESGTLQIDGNYGNSAVTVLSGAKLQGNGSLGGTVDIQSGATLSPGASIGVLGGSGSATLAGTIFIELDKANSTNDMFVATAGLNYGGDLIVTNLGGTLAVGDAFKIFDSSAYAGVFNTITLPSGIPAGAIWNLDTLAVDGTIRITGPTLNVVNNGTSLDFSWTGSYKLQAQTNNINTGLSNNWFDYPGGNSSPVTVGINPANAAVFFRLSTP